MENLPTWMRGAPRMTETRRPRWTRREHRDEGWLDEVVPVERLPAWMRQGSWIGPAPPDLECIDGAFHEPAQWPSPDAEALVDPIYE